MMAEQFKKSIPVWEMGRSPSDLRNQEKAGNGMGKSSQPDGIPGINDLNPADVLISRQDQSESQPTLNRVGNGLNIVSIPSSGQFLSVDVIDSSARVKQGTQPLESPMSDALDDSLIALNKVGQSFNAALKTKDRTVIDGAAQRYVLAATRVIRDHGRELNDLPEQKAGIAEAVTVACSQVSNGATRAALEKIGTSAVEGMSKMSVSPLLEQVSQALAAAADQLGNDPQAIKDLLIQLVANLDAQVTPTTGSSSSSSSASSSGSSGSSGSRSSGSTVAPSQGGSTQNARSTSPTGPTGSQSSTLDTLSSKVDSLSDTVEKLAQYVAGHQTVQKFAADRPYGEVAGKAVSSLADQLGESGVFTALYGGGIHNNMTQEKFDGLAKWMNREN